MRLFVYRCWLPSQKGVIFAFIGPMVAITMVRITLWLSYVFVMIVIDVYVMIYIICVAYACQRGYCYVCVHHLYT